MPEIAKLESMEHQLIDLYKEREYLQNELGTANSEHIVAMVRSMEDQLRDFYKDKETV